MHREGDGRLSKSIWGNEPTLTPERKLWRAVLEQAFADAAMTAMGEEAGAEPFESSRARQYLRADNFEEAEHLKLVCGFAEIPVDRLILWARRRYPSVHPFENQLECGSAADAFSVAELPGFLRSEPSARPQEAELCSRAPQDATPRQAVAAT